MTQIALQQKLEQAINDIIDSAINRDTLPPEVRRQLQDGVRREAQEKSTRLYEYLQEFIFQKIVELEGKVQNLEERVRELGSASPTDTTTFTT